MKHETWNPIRRKVTRGFSLVELLTVVAIIVLLIGILIPAVNHVRTSARVTATDTAIKSTLSTGLEMYRADQNLGGTLPPSASDQARGSDRSLTYFADSPFGEISGTTQLEMTGSGLLVWALAGADLLGCPGFKTFTGSPFWANDTSDEPGSGEAYELDVNREPVHPRSSPFVDLSKVELTRWNASAENGGSFEIPGELEAREALGTPSASMPQRYYPMFLDSFGGPILYWRADPAGRRIADRSPNSADLATPQDRGVYHWRDNAPLLATDPGFDQEPLVLQPSNVSHRLFWDPDAELIDPDPTLPLQRGFAGYIRDKNISAQVMTQRKDSYLLISAGPDGLFGTGDDIANFDHNGAELVP